jgi:DNA recombination protein RmuC
MDLLISGIAVVAALAVAAFFAYMRVRGQNEQIASLRDEIAVERDRAAAAEAKANEAERHAIEAQTSIGAIGAQLAESKETRETLARELELAKDARGEADKNTALARQEIDSIRTRMEDWEKNKEEAMATARSAMLTNLTDLSNKLLEDHKREAKTAKEEGEKTVKVTTDKLLSEVGNLSKYVASLNDQVLMNKDSVDVIRQALSNPASAGYAAETVLENTLNAFGLRHGTDFTLQKSFKSDEGARLRPDAVVFLPGDTLLVIDSKASKHIMALAEAEDSETEESVYLKLRESMNLHLRSLTSKNYRSAILNEYKLAGRAGSARQIINIMWLHNDAAVEKVLRADPEFQRKASENKIFVVGPTGLWTAVGVAGSQIKMAQQVEEQEQIVHGVQELINRLVVVLSYAGKVGGGLKLAVDSYDKLSRSINTRLLPPMRKLVDLGIDAPTKGLPKPMPEFQVQDSDRRDAIDAESSRSNSAKELPLPAGE